MPPVTIDGTSGITTPMYGGAITANVVTPSVNMKSRIINGAMVIDQRNAGASVTPTADNTYTLDRWKARLSVASKFSVQQQTSVVPTGFTNAIKITSLAATSLGASDYYQIQQDIEGFNTADLGWGTANAKTVTISAWVYSSLTGTFGGVITNASFARSYPFSYSIPIANTWTQISVTIAGDTSGTWLTTNGVGLQMVFSLGMGSTYSGTAGAWVTATLLSATGATSVVGTNGATFYITGVQLEVGSTATSFDYRPYGTELALCQRYFQLLVNNSQSPAGFGNVDTTSAFQISIPTAVQMRGTPTYNDATGRFRYNGNNITPSGYTVYAVNSNLVNILASTSGASLNYSGTFTVNGGASLSAEL